MSFLIFTDSAANLQRRHIDRYGISVIPLSYTLNGTEYTCTDPDAFDGKAFYELLKNGASAHTSQIPPQLYIETMEPALQSGQDVLFIGLSSGVSGTVNSAEMAAKQLRPLYPERKIRIVDTLGASLGEGLQVLHGCELREAGYSIDETADLLIERRKRMSQLFTVDDLMHLRKTGRISGVAAVVGTVLNIKPLLKGNEAGKIVSYAKARGRKQAIRAIADQYAKLVVDSESQVIGLSHANCPEDAQMLIQLVQQRAPVKDVIVVCHEPVTGVHVGPGMLALFFEGAENVRSL